MFVTKRGYRASCGSRRRWRRCVCRPVAWGLSSAAPAPAGRRWGRLVGRWLECPSLAGGAVGDSRLSSQARSFPRLLVLNWEKAVSPGQLPFMRDARSRDRPESPASASVACPLVDFSLPVPRRGVRAFGGFPLVRAWSCPRTDRGRSKVVCDESRGRVVPRAARYRRGGRGRTNSARVRYGPSARSAQ